MLEEQLKNEIAVKYFKKFICTDIIKRIDFTVRTAETDYLLWAEAKQQPTDIYKMLAQLLITIKQDAYEINPPKFLGCFDNEKITFIEYYDVLPVFNLNDFNWTQTPSQVDDKTVANVKNTIDKNKIFTFFYDKDEYELKNFIAENFNGSGSLLSTFIDKNNFIFVYQKWRKAVMPFIKADWETLKKNYSVYDRDFWLAELNIDDNGTADISDDKTVNEDFYITFSANEKKPYELLRKDGLGMEVSYKFGFKDGGKERYAEFWKLYKRPPKEEIWKYIISRLDLLVPQDVRERKGAFFTPQIWVEKSQEYIADVLGEDWQDEYYVWDCCAGTGNLLNGLKNKYRIFASTLDQQDVDVMKERIKNGANLLESHVFQFDFLNDDFSKCPQSLQDIIFDNEKRKKLVIYINPPYAEAGNEKTSAGTGENKAGVSKINKIYDKYKSIMGKAQNEIYALFLIRIYKELPDCVIGEFSKLKGLNAPNFDIFRDVFTPKLEKLFVVPGNTFDNVSGDFPIGFFIWDTRKKEIFSDIEADVYTNSGIYSKSKLFFVPEKHKLLSDWIRIFYDNKNKDQIGYLTLRSSALQNSNYVTITTIATEANIAKHMVASITTKNLINICIYLATRHCIEHSWLNDRDQFLFPNDGWKTDNEFQKNCLVWTLFHGQNRISCRQGINHWIPFSESEVNAKEMFQSHFMKDFLDGKIKAEKQNKDLFSYADATPVETRLIASLQFAETAKSVMSAGKELWKYYHTKLDANPNASLYDIKEYFQGRNEKGKMNSSSTDPIYTDLLNALKNSLRLLGEEIKPKVYEYGFLK